MPRARSPSGWLRACGVGYTPRRVGATRRAVSTQLVGNPVCAHYRHHVTPGICRREGTLRRGFPRPEPRLVGSQARHSSARRWELLEPGGFPLIAWLARARASPRSHQYPCGSGGVRRRARPGERCAQPLTASQRAASCGVAAPQWIRGKPPHRATLRASRARAGEGTRRGVRVGSCAPE